MTTNPPALDPTSGGRQQREQLRTPPADRRRRPPSDPAALGAFAAALYGAGLEKTDIKAPAPGKSICT